MKSIRKQFGNLDSHAFPDQTNEDIDDFFLCLEYLLKKLPYNFKVKISTNGVVTYVVFAVGPFSARPLTVVRI